jgi:preprotein translocase subunit SecF
MFPWRPPAAGDAAQQCDEQGADTVKDKYEVRRSEVVGPRFRRTCASSTIGVVLSISPLAYLCSVTNGSSPRRHATMHDLLLTIDSSLTRIEFNITSIAAILTIVGVSLNRNCRADRIRDTAQISRRPSPISSTCPSTVIHNHDFHDDPDGAAAGPVRGHVIQSFSLP